MTSDLTPGWWVRLDGEAFDLQQLPKELGAGEVVVVQRDERYYLRASDFDGIDDAQAIERRGEEIVRVVNGAAKVRFGNHQAVRVGAVARVQPDGSVQHFVFLSSAIRARSRITASLSGAEAGAAADALTRTARMTQHGLDDAAAEQALRIFGRDDLDYRDLYFVYEIVRAFAATASLRKAGRRSLS